MEAIGAVSSIFAIYNQLEKCGKRLHRLKHTFQFAKQEVNLLADEVSACKSLFGIFSHIGGPLDNRVMKLARQQNLDETLKSQATFAFGQIGEIFLKLEPLRKQSNASRFEQLIAKLRWHWMKDEVQLPLITLASFKMTLTALNCLLILDSRSIDMKRPSISKIEMKSLKMQIKQLRRTINRQERCLRRLSKRMSEFSGTRTQPKLVVNTKLMVVTINQIKQHPLSEAQSLINEDILDSSARTSTPSSKKKSSIKSRKTFVSTLPRTPSDISGPSQHGSYSEAGASVIIEHMPETLLRVFRDYGDGNREIPEVGSSISHSSPNEFPDSMKSKYAPMPPFRYSDLRLRKQGKRDD